MKSAEPQTKSKRAMPVATGQTGPKTAYGKSRSALNAMKSGIHSRSPSSLAALEEKATFRVAIDALKAEHPYAAGELGSFLLTQLAMLKIRQMRLWQLESKAFADFEAGADAATTLEPVRRYISTLSRETDAIIDRLAALRPNAYEGSKAVVQARQLEKFHAAK